MDLEADTFLKYLKVYRNDNSLTGNVMKAHLNPFKCLIGAAKRSNWMQILFISILNPRNAIVGVGNANIVTEAT